MPSAVSHLTPRTTIAALVGAGVLMTGGIAAAATGLPGAAQDIANPRPEQAGASVPGPNEHSAGHADSRGASADHAADPGTGSDGDENGKGAAVSELARKTDATGVDKGAEISSAASGDHSQAGQHGAAEAPEQPAAGGGESDGHAQVGTPNSGGAHHPENASGTGAGADQSTPVETPNSGGTGTADDASGGASTHGTGTADYASGGHSLAGSQNRP